MNRVNKHFACESFPGGAVHELSQRLAKSQQIPDVFGGKVWARASQRSAFAADLDDADDFAAEEDRGANNLLN